MKVSPAYTLIEILLVIALVGILTIGGITAFITARNNQDLVHTSDHLVDTLRRAHIFSRDGRDEKEWGVQSTAESQYGIVFRDNASSAPEISASYTIPRSVKIESSPFDLWFGKGTGELEFPATISLTNTNNQKTIIHIEKTGVISFESE